MRGFKPEQLAALALAIYVIAIFDVDFRRASPANGDVNLASRQTLERQPPGFLVLESDFANTMVVGLSTKEDREKSVCQIPEIEAAWRSLDRTEMRRANGKRPAAIDVMIVFGGLASGYIYRSSDYEFDGALIDGEPRVEYENADLVAAKRGWTELIDAMERGDLADVARHCTPAQSSGLTACAVGDAELRRSCKRWARCFKTVRGDWRQSSDGRKIVLENASDDGDCFDFLKTSDGWKLDYWHRAQ